MQKQPSTSTDQATSGVLDLIENFSFILDKSCKRALMSLSIVNTCSMFNFINEILSDQFSEIFEIRFLIFTGLIKGDSVQYQKILTSKLHKISNLFELTEKCGFHKTSENVNITNQCLIQTFNRFYHFTENLQQLETLM